MTFLPCIFGTMTMNNMLGKSAPHRMKILPGIADFLNIPDIPKSSGYSRTPVFRKRCSRPEGTENNAVQKKKYSAR